MHVLSQPETRIDLPKGGTKGRRCVSGAESSSNQTGGAIPLQLMVLFMWMEPLFAGDGSVPQRKEQTKGRNFLFFSFLFIFLLPMNKKKNKKKIGIEEKLPGRIKSGFSSVPNGEHGPPAKTSEMLQDLEIVIGLSSVPNDGPQPSRASGRSF